MKRIVIVSSAHGFGHATRDAVLADTLWGRGHEVTQFTHVSPAVLGARHTVEFATTDVGFVQHHSLAENVPATMNLLEERFGDAAVDALARRFASFDLVIADIPPTAMLAAKRAGVPCVAMGNFDWGWIYREYASALDGVGVMDGGANAAERLGLRTWAARIGQIQREIPAISLSPGSCGLAGFALTQHGGILARSARPMRVAEVGVLVCFGGLGLEAIEAILPEVPGITWIFSPPMPKLNRRDCVYVEDVPFPALLAGAECVLTKPGYGSFAETIMAGTRAVWLERRPFPEAPLLEADFCGHARRRAKSATRADVSAALLRVLQYPKPAAPLHDDREEIADLVLDLGKLPA